MRPRIGPAWAPPQRRIGGPCSMTRTIRLAALGAALGLSLCLLGAPAVSEASPPTPISALPLPSLGAFERGEYRARDAQTGADLWRTRWTVEEDSRDGHQAFHVEETGAGRRDSDRHTAWAVKMDVTLSHHAGRLASAREIRGASGDLLETQRHEFDYAAGKGSVAVTDARTGGVKSTTFPVTPDTIGVEMLPTELRVLPDAANSEVRFQLVTREGKVLPMTARIVGRERVRVPAGSFECYKIQLTVGGFMGWLADFVLPKMFMWHAVASPHIWVKYQGPAAGLGSPEVVMELVRFEAEQR